jgi:cytoskeletal protein CcmA (bactofilin family)
MWRKQPEVKPSSPAVSTRDSAYTPQSQKLPTPPASASVQAAQPSFSQPPPSDSGVLTRGICINGELTGKADLVIDGDVKGSIRLGDSRLTVGQAGHVQADIEASEIVVQGQVEGDLRGRERVVLGSSCRVVGDLEGPRVVIEDGARFKGRVEMGPVADARERQSKRSQQPFNPREASPSSAEGDSAPVGAGMERNSH